jgi:hypothetical protein
MSFWGVKRGIKRRQSDIHFSKLVRKERGYICEFCGKPHEENSMNIGLSHFWPRSHGGVRYDRRNVDVLCNIPCHNMFEGHRKTYIEWKKKRMGEKAYDRLEFDAHATKSSIYGPIVERALSKQFLEELRKL